MNAHNPRHNRWHYNGWIVLLAVSLITPGCRDDRRHNAAEEIEITHVAPPVADDATPDGVVMALLDGMKTLQDIRAAGMGKPGNRKEYNQTLGTIISLIARDAIYKKTLDIARRGASTVPKDITPSTAHRLVAESWVSMAAHYVDGFSTEPPTTTIASTGQTAEVRVRVENPRERAILEEEILPAIGNADQQKGVPPSLSDPETLKRAREMALAHGFNIPIAAELTFQLFTVDGAWRVKAMTIRSASPRGPVIGPKPTATTTPGT
ncbi:MAG: hypothetical protein ACE5EC_00915 [Phycisphaerae bacterium]